MNIDIFISRQYIVFDRLVCIIINYEMVHNLLQCLELLCLTYRFSYTSVFFYTYDTLQIRPVLVTVTE